MIKWGPVIDEARDIVNSYETPVTLRQLHYRLVAAQLITNTVSSYKRLSDLTSTLRQTGDFPELADRTRSIHEYLWFDSPQDGIDDLVETYRRDRTQGQDVSIYLAVEKAGIVNQFQQWFGDPMGIPILALGGYASQSYVNTIKAHVRAQDRPAILLYGGDHDPSGWDIPRDFLNRTDCWKEVRRIGLTPALVRRHRLPHTVDADELYKRDKDGFVLDADGQKIPRDPRAAGFIERFGALVQVELDALPVEVLQGLFRAALAPYWDKSTAQAVLTQERADRATLRRLRKLADEG
jgi:hypothetical protein